MEIDPRRMLTFAEVARQRSFSKAAADLSLTQSAVSQRVAALERQLGVKLLHRGPAGVHLTPAGERLMEHASALDDRIRLAGTQLRELAAAERNQLRLGAFPSALATIVPAAVTGLRERAPDLEVRLTEGRVQHLPAGVRNGELHAAVCFQDAGAPRREHEGARRHELIEEPMLLALPPGHRLVRRRDARLADLRDDPWTAPSRDGIIANACRAAGFEPHITILTSDPLAIRGVVRAGLAVTLAPRLLAPQFEGVHVRPVTGPAPSRTLYVLLPDAGARPLDHALLDELRRAVAAA